MKAACARALTASDRTCEGQGPLHWGDIVMRLMGAGAGGRERALSMTSQRGLGHLQARCARWSNFCGQPAFVPE